MTGPGTLEKKEEVNKTTINFWYTGADTQALSEAVQAMFLAEGYKLEKGTPNDGVYGKGSAGMRVLLGGFVERNKFSIQIHEDAPRVCVRFSPDMTGLSGGVWGKSQVEKEFQRIAQKFR
jgi:hypothetical protein